MTKVIEDYRIDGNEKGLGEITLTVHQNYLSEKGTADDVIDFVNGRNVICDIVQVHIVQADNLHAVFESSTKMMHLDSSGQVTTSSY